MVGVAIGFEQAAKEGCVDDSVIRMENRVWYAG
jgi:hypothetical protein